MRSSTVFALILLGTVGAASAEPKQEERSERVSLNENDATNDPPRSPSAWIELADPTTGKHGTMYIIVGEEAGFFSRLRVDAAKGRMHVKAVKVFFDDGTSKNVRLDRTLSANGKKSAFVDLGDTPKAIDRVVVVTDRGSSGLWSLHGTGVDASREVVGTR